MLCRYHNLDGAEALCGKKGVEKIMQRIHSIQYDPLNVVARNADLVLQARVKDYSESVLYDLLYKEHKLIDGFDKEMCIYDIKDFARLQFVRNEYEKQALPTLKYRNQTGVLNNLTFSIPPSKDEQLLIFYSILHPFNLEFGYLPQIKFQDTNHCETPAVDRP